MKNLFRVIFLSVCTLSMISLDAQALRIPGNTNFASSAGRRIGATEIENPWNAPASKVAKGNIWGTNIAWYGFQVLGLVPTVHLPGVPVQMNALPYHSPPMS